jgi:drug/metabolite transporter (DMT)-like permease
MKRVQHEAASAACKRGFARAWYSAAMRQRLSPTAIVLLVIPPLLWSGNAVVGRWMSDLISPMTLNFLRWVGAFVLLLPMAGHVLRPGSALWPQWRHFAFLSLFSIGGYNALLYLALHTSTPLNVTLVGASTPVWMLLLGRVLFHETVTVRQLLGAALSILGVVLVLCRGEWAQLQALHLMPGDVYILLASVGWAFYSWKLQHPTAESASLRSNGLVFLLAQVAFGLVWSGAFMGAEWAMTDAHVEWSWPLAAGLAFVAVGPAVIAYAAWNKGVTLAGPNAAGFFVNLTPLFTALLSTAFLGEAPHVYHALAFALIVTGIVFSAGGAQTPKPR